MSDAGNKRGPQSGSGQEGSGGCLFGTQSDVGAEPRLGASLIEDLGEPVTGRVVNPGSIGEDSKVDGSLPAGEKIVLRHHDHQLLIAEALNPARPTARRRSDGDVGYPGPHPRRHGLAVTELVEAQAHTRMGLPPPTQGAGQEPEGG